MKFSTQLSTSIIGITILTQAVFGLIVYRVIDKEQINSDHIIFQHIINNVSKKLTSFEDTTPTQTQLNKIHEQSAAPEIILLIEDNFGNSFISGNKNHTPDSFFSALKKTKKISLPPSAIYGHLNINKDDYHWFSKKSDNNQYRITLLKKKTDISQHSVLGIRLITTSLIIIWIAVWLALFLSKIIGRQLKEKSDALKHQATHDELTGLANRNLLFDRIEQARLTSKRNKTPFALFIMDLDNFKEINDALGHHFGDLMLKKISRIIRKSLRENDSVARLGGDEFAILLPNTDEDGAIVCAQKILNTLAMPFSVRDTRIESSTSIGIVLYPQDGDDSETLLQRADIAMYQAKQTRNHYVVYDQSKGANNIRQLTLMRDLREAIKADLLDVYYQPMIDQKTGCTVAAEALARWNHPKLGFISPEEFIPIAERTGLIRKLTLSVMKQAMFNCKQWQDMGYDMMIAINISTHCLQDQSFPGKTNQLLQTSGISAYSVELEITETALMQDIGSARQILQKLDRAGFNLSIDDFGTGFSSLAYLKELPVDTLKIDKSFVFDMDNNEDDTAIVQTVIELAHNFKCKVIAEGVETTSALEQLKGLGNDIAQGYLFSKPIPFEEFNQWLKNSEWKPAIIDKEQEKKVN